MATNNKKPAQKPAAIAKPSRTRTKRNAQERRCLSKSSKRLFAGADKSLIKLVLEAEQNLKRRKHG